MAVIGTFNGASIIALPTSPLPKSVEFTMNDAVAVVSSPFSGQTQVQQWPGADSWTGMVTMPPLTQPQADDWISFLMELRGMSNVFRLGDPMKTAPRGNVHGSPVMDMSTTGNNIVGAQTLFTRGWTPSLFGLLLPGDYLQIGNRLHRCLDRVNSDSSGHANFQVWPSLRDLPTDGEQIVLKSPTGLFRLGKNQRTYSADFTWLTQLSFPIMEAR